MLEKSRWVSGTMLACFPFCIFSVHGQAMLISNQRVAGDARSSSRVLCARRWCAWVLVGSWGNLKGWSASITKVSL